MSVKFTGEQVEWIRQLTREFVYCDSEQETSQIFAEKIAECVEVKAGSSWVNSKEAIAIVLEDNIKPYLESKDAVWLARDKESGDKCYLTTSELLRSFTLEGSS